MQKVQRKHNTLQWAERQRSLKAKSALGCGIRVGLKESKFGFKGGHKFHGFEADKTWTVSRVGPISSVMWCHCQGNTEILAWRTKIACKDSSNLPMKLSKRDHTHSSFTTCQKPPKTCHRSNLCEKYLVRQRARLQTWLEGCSSRANCILKDTQIKKY